MGRRRGRIRGTGARRPLPPAPAARRRVRTRRDPRLRHLQRPGGAARQVLLPEVVSAEPVAAPAGTAGRPPAGPWRRRAPRPRYPTTRGWCRSSTSSSRTAACGSSANWSPRARWPRSSPTSRLTPYRAAEVASDVLTALRALHAHGWTHRNVTARTVLVCDDGRAMLGGLAAGAAQEALCGYDPVPGAGPAMADGGTRQRRGVRRLRQGPRSALEQERARQDPDHRRRRGHRALGARAGRPGARELAARRRPSAPRPTCGRWARCSSAAVQGHPPYPGGERRRAGAAGVRRAARLRRGVRPAAARRGVAAAPGPRRAARLRGAARLAALAGPLRARAGRWACSTVPVPARDPARLPVVRPPGRAGAPPQGRAPTRRAVPAAHGRPQARRRSRREQPVRGAAPAGRWSPWCCCDGRRVLYAVLSCRAADHGR